MYNLLYFRHVDTKIYTGHNKTLHVLLHIHVHSLIVTQVHKYMNMQNITRKNTKKNLIIILQNSEKSYVQCMTVLQLEIEMGRALFQV